MSDAKEKADPTTKEETAEEPSQVSLLPAEYWTQLGPIEPADDADSAIVDDQDSSTASIASSIFKYRTIQGRTYHSEIGNAEYWGTNDEATANLWIFCIWAIDMADQFPEATVTGTDVSPIQPSWVPPNVKLLHSRLDLPSDAFDFVHMRYLNGCVVDWYALFREAFRVLEPGSGWVQSYECSPRVLTGEGGEPLPKDSAMAQWPELFIQGGKQIGRSFTVVDDETQRKAMAAAGFVDIQERVVKVPGGGWPEDPRDKEIGTYALYAIESDIEGFVLFVTNVQRWSREQVQVYIAHLRRELHSLKHHAYCGRGSYGGGSRVKERGSRGRERELRQREGEREFRFERARVKRVEAVTVHP